MRRITLFLVLAVAVSSCWVISTNKEQLNDNKLQRRTYMENAACSVILWRVDHDGHYPQTLEEALEEAGGPYAAEHLTHCPFGGAKYVYVNWSRWFADGKVPNGYPLVYESEIGQHGNGINVVLMDISAFWDEMLNGSAILQKNIRNTNCSFQPTSTHSLERGQAGLAGSFKAPMQPKDGSEGR